MSGSWGVLVALGGEICHSPPVFCSGLGCSGGRAWEKKRIREARSYYIGTDKESMPRSA